MNKVYLFCYVLVSIAYFISVSKLKLNNPDSSKRTLYFFFYITCNLLTLSLIYFFTTTSVQIIQPLMVVSHMNSFLFLYLHTRVLINQDYIFRPYAIFFGCNILILFFFLLNYQGVYLFTRYNPTDLFTFIDINYLRTNFGDFVITAKWIYFMFVILTLRLVFINLGYYKTNNLSTYKYIRNWYFLFAFFNLSLLTLNLYYYYYAEAAVSIMTYMVPNMNFSLLIMFHFFPHYISIIDSFYIDRNPKEIDPVLLSGFEELVKLIMSEKLYLIKDLTLNEIAFKSGYSVPQIRAFISASQHGNFKDFINYLRVKHAKYLIDNGYLKDFNIIGLLGECGFNSHPTFYRAFKRVYDFTPNEYWVNKSKPSKDVN